MDIMVWVVGAMLAAVGLVQMIAWVVCRAPGSSKKNIAFKVIRLEKEKGKLDDQLRYELLLLHWCTPVRPELLLFVDDGLGEEEKKLCKQMICDFQTAVLCAPEDIGDLIRSAE